ncbi:MAG: Transcriptional regulator, XRE family [Candidatus Woesebacteria bacterium GW2011_GWC2_45_9]|uniref:Transcriptional regulator, XRE family n=2 Tax=Microgenomates group TaxID=1794810 RepID=A0A0G1N5W4_9BACT|nr:MAG: XRE family transcriptional regulator [Candidatus Curtissbacteria bacterium GW2011_GWC1_44_33]KKU15939.1 MAG: Transcriptional regulator, XRE family [Candidatus Woesebacteria bacterium GW2011_GWC2_45_9]
MDWKTHKRQLLRDPEVRRALKESGLEFQIAKSIIEARIKRGLTQKELARRLNTKQSVISRVETAKTTPSLSFLKRLAEVLDTSLRVQIGA